MPFTNSWDAVVANEAAWWTTDTVPTFPGAPPLQKANGGRFDSVQAYRPKVPPRGKSVFIHRDYMSPQMELRESMGGLKFWRNPLVAEILWSFTESTGKAEDLEQHLEQGIADVLARVRGPFGDKTHNGAFQSVGEDSGDISVHFLSDPVEAIQTRSSVVVHVRYVADSICFVS